MTRSVWKGPFVDGYLLAKAETSRASGRNEIIKIWSRRSTILPQFVGLTFGVYNGHKFLPVQGFDIEYAALYRNDGGMNFSDMSIASGIARGTQGYVGWGDAFVDFDNGGWEDFFLVNGHVYPQVDSAHLATRYLEPKLLFVNQRDGSFKNASRLIGEAIQIAQVSRGLAVGDLSTTERWRRWLKTWWASP